MKPLLQAKTLIIVATLLAVAGFPAGAQEQAGAVAITQYNQADAPQQTKLLGNVSRNISVATSFRESQSRIIVVPTAKTTPEKLASLTEDLDIMAMVFDKKLKDAGIDIERRSSFFALDAHPTGVLHLEGYGPIFMLRVNFPLAPPLETESTEGTDDSAADPLWLEMKYQRNMGDAGWSNMVLGHSDTKVVPYEADKVEKLKKTLIEAMAHASNIRDLGPQEKLTITIQGTHPHFGERDVARTEAVTYRGNVLHRTWAHVTWSPNVLTIRAAKADIDGFAKGKINSDKFAEKVEVFTSYRSSSDHGPLLSFTSPQQYSY
jgi:hypothetical protein